MRPCLKISYYLRTKKTNCQKVFPLGQINSSQFREPKLCPSRSQDLFMSTGHTQHLSLRQGRLWTQNFGNLSCLGRGPAGLSSESNNNRKDTYWRVLCKNHFSKGCQNLQFLGHLLLNPPWRQELWETLPCCQKSPFNSWSATPLANKPQHLSVPTGSADTSPDSISRRESS